MPTAPAFVRFWTKADKDEFYAGAVCPLMTLSDISGSNCCAAVGAPYAAPSTRGWALLDIVTLTERSWMAGATPGAIPLTPEKGFCEIYAAI